MPCPHCGSQSIPFSDVDREYYCMNCNRGKPRPVEPLNITDEMLHEPQHNRMITFYCSNPGCGKQDTKKKNSKRGLCADCQKKVNNARTNALKYKRVWYVSTTQGFYTCVFCNKEIHGIVYKKKRTREFACKECYHRNFDRKSKNKGKDNL